MNALIVADTDEFLHGLATDSVDVLLSCGDITDGSILSAAKKVSARHVLAVKGNHDSSATFSEPIVNLHLSIIEIGGLRFGGFQGAWRYKPKGNYLYEQFEVTELLSAFPPVDVFVAHNSPRHVHDRDDDVHLGFEGFADYIYRAKPRLFIHGHQHISKETKIGESTVVGVYGCTKIPL